MGTVLAMIRGLTLCCMITLLGACAIGFIPFGLGGLAGEQPSASRNVRAGFTPEAIAGFDGPLMFAALPDRGVEAGLVPGPMNGTVALWATPDGGTLSFDRGVLTATRGLGGDLMSSDVSDVVSAVLYGGLSEGDRVHTYLDQENQLVLRALRCAYSRQSGVPSSTLARTFTATQVSERCFDAAGGEIANEYWLDTTGRVRKSLQWVGPDVGYLESEWLKDR